MIRLLLAALAISLLALALAVSPPLAGEPEKPAKPAAGEELAKIKARVAELIKLLGSDEWAKREEASKELATIGSLAEPALEEAAKSNDPETSLRAAEVLQKIKSAPKRRKKKFDPNATDGYQLVCDGREQVQTFKATGDKIEFLKIRAARTINNPAAELTVSLRESGAKADAEPLATGSADNLQVTRYYRWFTMEFKAEKLEKGKTYELVFSSKTGKDSPWLVNCFYRDAYPDGEHRELADGKPVKSDKKFDLVFEALGGDDKFTSVPKDVDLSKKDEHFGIGPDGTDLHQEPPKIPLDEGGAL
jgi:hypothetical protein